MDEKIELESLADEIKLTEQKLGDLRKEYRDRKTAGVRELRAIGYRDSVDFWRGRAY